MRKKVLSLLLVTTTAFASITACGGRDSAGNADSASSPAQGGENTESAAGNGGTEDGKAGDGFTLPISEEKIEITVLCPFFSQYIEDPNEIKGVQAMEERTNIHVNWMCYDTSQMVEKWSQILASGDLPDVMFPAGTNVYPGRYLQGIEDGVMFDINEHPEWFPNYFSLLDASVEGKKQATSDDGIIHAVKVIRGTDTEIVGPGAIVGPAIRQDILEELGLDTPETIEELHDALVKARDELGMTAPLQIETDAGGCISLAWGVMTGPFAGYYYYDPDTQKVSYTGLSDGLYEYLDTMKEWYAEGLIDKNFTSPGALWTGDYSSFENDDTLFYTNWSYANMGTYLQDNDMITNEDCYLQAIPGFILNEGDEMVHGNANTIINQDIYINADSEHLEAVSRWVDYQFSREGINFRYYGIEGESYTVSENGEIQFTDQILNNPDGLSVSDALYQYAMRTYLGFQNDGADARVALAASSSDRDIMTESQRIWTSPAKSIALPAGVEMTAEEMEIYNTYNTALTTMLQEYMTKYVLGQEVPSKEEFKQQLIDNGVNEVLEVEQAAVDRYNNR